MTYAALLDRHIIGSGLQEAEEARMSRRLGLDDEAGLATSLAAVRGLAAASGQYPLLAGWLACPAGPPATSSSSSGWASCSTASPPGSPHQAGPAPHSGT